jgi:mono/diheme cytochrome c family protein
MTAARRFAGVFVALALCAAPAAAQNERGQALAQQYCGECHATGKTGDSPLPPAPPLRRISNSYNLDEFASLLRRGALLPRHPAMPTYKFDPESAQALTNYLRSIQE